MYLFGRKIKVIPLDLNEKIENAIEGPLDNKGYDVVQVRIIGGKNLMLEVDIDRQDRAPVGIDDCTAASHIISAILDVEDFISSKYYLNVNSPGEKRLLRKVKDFERFCGNDVRIELLNPLNGRKKFSGKLVRIEQNSANVVVYLKEGCDTEAVELGILYKDIAKAYVKRKF